MSPRRMKLLVGNNQSRTNNYRQKKFGPMYRGDAKWAKIRRNVIQILFMVSIKSVQRRCMPGSKATEEGWEDKENSNDKNAVRLIAKGEADVRITYFNFIKII